MKKNKPIAIIYFIAAFIWSLTALVNAKTSNDSMFPVNIALSITCLLLGLLYLRGSKDDSKKNKN